MYLQDIDDDLHSGIRCNEDKTTLSPEDYGDMHTDNRTDDGDGDDDDDEEVVPVSRH